MYIEYWVHRDGQGQGLMTDAVFAFIQTAVRELGRKCVRSAHIVCNPNNKASQAVALRLGFPMLGTGKTVSYGDAVHAIRRVRFWLPLE